MVEIKDQFQIYFSLQKITCNMKEMQKETNKFITQYEDFSFLWKEDLEESFQKFIDSGEMPTGIKKKKQANVEEGQEGDEEEEIDEAYQWMANKILTGV